MKPIIKVKNYTNDADFIPKASSYLELKAYTPNEVTNIKSKCQVAVRTGINFEIPVGYELLILDVNLNRWMTTLSITEDIIIWVLNDTKGDVTIRHKDIIGYVIITLNHIEVQTTNLIKKHD